jgi:hypothetical protein
MTRRAGSRWLSRPAVLWAFYDAEGVPTHLVAALIVVAAHAGEDGRGAYPSVATVAAAIRKNKRNTKRDLAELCELGLLLPGDASLARKIRADRRPNVYDLPMLRGGADDTRYSSDGVSHRTARGVAQGHHGVSRMTPEKSLKRPRRIPPGAGERADPIEQIIEAFKTCTGKTVSRGWAEQTARARPRPRQRAHQRRIPVRHRRDRARRPGPAVAPAVRRPLRRTG